MLLQLLQLHTASMAKRSRAIESDTDSEDAPLANRLKCKPSALGHDSKVQEPTQQGETKKQSRSSKKKQRLELQQHGEQEQEQQHVHEQPEHPAEQHQSVPEEGVAISKKQRRHRKHTKTRKKHAAQPDAASAEQYVIKEAGTEEDAPDAAALPLTVQTEVKLKDKDTDKAKKKKNKQGHDEDKTAQRIIALSHDDAAEGKHEAAQTDGKVHKVKDGRMHKVKEADAAPINTDVGLVQPELSKRRKRKHKAGTPEHGPDADQTAPAPAARTTSEKEQKSSKQKKASKTAGQLSNGAKAGCAHEKGEQQQQQQPSMHKAKHKASDDDLWYKRCRRIILSCLELDCYEVIAKSLVTWKAPEVMELVKDWTPHTFAAVLASYPANKLAELLQHSTPARVAAMCESWPVEQLIDVLPLLRTKTVRQVLRLLYFNAPDPYLTLVDAKHILMAMPEQKREKVCKKLKRKSVKKVLNADEEAADSLNEEDDLASDNDDSYESSFVVSDEDDIEEGEEVDAYAELEDSDC